MKKLFLYIVFLLAIIGCRKEGDLLTGDIMGKVVVRDDDFSYPDDQSAEVRLYSNTSLIDVVTADSRGIYRFSEKPYGKYSLDVIREYYIKPGNYDDRFLCYHLGGASPTLIGNIGLSEIPTFDLTIDSVAKVNLSYSLKIFIKVNGGVIRPNAALVGYLSNSPDVSSDNYTLMARGNFLDRDYSVSGNKLIPVFASLDHFFSDYKPLKSDTIYIRLYPVAAGQNYYSLFSIQALGKPSNVIGFIWK